MLEDIELAKHSWPWSHFPEDESTWDDCVTEHQVALDKVAALEKIVRDFRIVPGSDPICPESLVGKMTIQFDLEEDHDRAIKALKGSNFASALWDMDVALRQVDRYGEDDIASDIASKWREKLREVCIDNGVDLYVDCG